MRSHRNGQRFPVDTDILYEELLLDDVPRIPRINTNGIDQQGLQSLHIGLIDTIQGNASKSLPRVALFNIAAQNQYNSDVYCMMLEVAIDLYLATDYDVPTIIEYTVAYTLTWMVDTYSDLMEMFPPNVQRTMNQLFAVADDVAAILNGQQPQQHNRQMGAARQMGGQRQPMRQNNRPNTRGNHNQQQTQRPSLHNKPRNRVQNTGRNRPSTVNQNTRYNEMEGEVVDEIERGLSHELSRSDVRKDVPSVSKHHTPLHTSKTKVVVLNDNQYGLVDAMEYEDHEENTNMIQLNRNLNTTSERHVAWADITAMSPISKDTTPEEYAALKEFEPIVFETVIAGNTPRDILAEGISHISKTYGKLASDVQDHSCEFIGSVITTHCIDADDAHWFEKFNEIVRTSEIAGIVNWLKMNQDTMTYQVYVIIHDAVLNTFNTRMQAGLGVFTWVITNVVDDYVEAMSMLSKEYDELVLDTFKSNLPAYIARRYNFMVTTEDESPVCRVSSICTTSVTRLNWTSNDMDLCIDGPYSVLIRNDADPVAHDSMLTAMLAIVERNTTCGRHLLCTDDDLWLEIQRTDIGVRQIVVSKASV